MRTVGAKLIIKASFRGGKGGKGILERGKNKGSGRGGGVIYALTQGNERGRRREVRVPVAPGRSLTGRKKKKSHLLIGNSCRIQNLTQRKEEGQKSDPGGGGGGIKKGVGLFVLGDQAKDLAEGKRSPFKPVAGRWRGGREAGNL